MKLKDFFASIGYNIDIYLNNKNSVSNYIAWYYGCVDSFHKYYVFNGDKKIYKNRFSLGFPKKICESFADLICNEKVKFYISSDSATELLRAIFEKNNFYTKLNQSIEKVFAFGLGAIVASADQDGINIQFISCDNIIPLTFDNNNIHECAFVSDSYDINGKIVRYVQIHSKNKNNQYVIYNYKFIVGQNDEITPYDEFEDVPASIETYSDIPWFSIIKPNIVNNIDINSPFGIPIYLNSLDTIKTLDIIYDSFVNEIQNGRKRLFVTSDALKVNSDGQLRNAFDPNDVVFYLLDSNISSENNNNGKYVQEVNGTLRINELRLALRTNLELLSMKLGLGKNYFQLENDSGYIKTATEVVSSNSDLYRTIHKHEIVVRESLVNLIKAIQFISKSIFNVNMDGDITIDFDDSVIESDLEKRDQDRRDVAMGAMSLAEYRSIWYDEPIELAATKVSDLRS